MGRHKKQHDQNPPETINMLDEPREPRTSDGEIVPDDEEEADHTLDKISQLEREVSQLKKELAWAYKNMTLNENINRPIEPSQVLSIKELNQLGRSGQYAEAIKAHENYLKSGQTEQARYVAQALNALRIKQAKACAVKTEVQPNTLQQFTRR